MDDNPYLTMSIASAGPATLPKFEPRHVATKNTIDVSDIDGAQPAPKYKVYTNKPIFQPSDVPGATSKQLIRGRNTRDNSLYIDDIEGTRRMIKDRMMQTKRHVNPLEPEYSLPSYSPVQQPAPKFVRDMIDVSDIEGTRPRPKKEFGTRDIMSVNDIDGSHPGSKHMYVILCV
ncbi:hypothetical protein EON63_20665 [archaeon]|nr:MAG: hypothetical protein EON63_20665 [archaeon]